LAEDAFANAKVPYRSLTDYPTLISLAVEKGQVSADTEQLLLSWRKDPAQWQGI
jgi:orotate phosphoribosyltransferase